MTTPFKKDSLRCSWDVKDEKTPEGKFFMMGGRSYRTINNFPLYGINHTGMVINNRTGEVLKTFKTAGGYTAVNLHKNPVIHTRLLHKLIVEHFDPTWDPTVHYMHQDGNKNNNHILNLTHEAIPLDAEKGEFDKEIVGVRIGFKGKVCANYREASNYTNLHRLLPKQLTSTYKSFVYNGVRFTSVFA